jgi:hypothetical protein
MPEAPLPPGPAMATGLARGAGRMGGRMMAVHRWVRHESYHRHRDARAQSRLVPCQCKPGAALRRQGRPPARGGPVVATRLDAGCLRDFDGHDDVRRAL